jgi:hypothetical protein
MTKIGAFATNEFEYNMYVNFFTEMLQNSGGITKSRNEYNCVRIESDLYDVRIFRRSNQLVRGYRFDIMFSSEANQEIRNHVLLPTMCNSKFK